MNKEKIIKSAYPFSHNDIWKQYLVPYKFSPLENPEIFGSWLLDFSSKAIMNTWQIIYEEFKKVVYSNSELKKCVDFEEIHQIDEISKCLNRGFNEAYTTSSYDEYLKYGDCKPNEWILNDLQLLEKALGSPFDYHLEQENKQRIIDELIEKSFVKPNLELKWTNEPFPWTLYIPPISMFDIRKWEKED
ncbi:hypothetical protein [Flammeovirga aprica]|uniref:Uncharacterized protein n=1 Tax=Flammeovirga aprica JL-4 TaxID=694437 RepID=A0A7X9XC04_9BACT|nr:hypothetical protein [Flammeovirga aprica]NME71245.1 hypothetical protein [Flammeovirga aprica JL-4]